MPFPYSLDDYAEEVKDFITENHLNKPSVIAHSFGGRIAIRLASKSPDLFDKIVLTGCAGLKPRRALKKSVKKLAFSVLKKFVKREKLTAFYSPDYLALDEVMKKSFVKIVAERLDGEIDKIQNRTLIINGNKDKDTPLYMAKKLNRRIKNSRLSIYKGAGHFCFIDKPQKFNKEVEEFLNS